MAMSDVIKNVSQPDILPPPMPIDKPNLASSSTDHGTEPIFPYKLTKCMYITCFNLPTEAAKTRNVTQSVLQSNALDETLKKAR